MLPNSLTEAKSLPLKNDGESLFFGSQDRLGSIEFLHPGHDFSRDTHAHVLEVSVVAHHVLDELIA